MKIPSVSTLVNAVLAGSAAYAMYVVKPAEPYAFTACGLAFWHGLLGVVASLNSDSDRCNLIVAISAGVMEIVPLSLFNIELYKTSGSYSDLAVVHFFFVIPLLFDFIAKLTSGFDGSTEILKDLTLLANVGSLIFLGVNEDVPAYIMMGTAMLLSKYGGLLVEYLMEDLVCSSGWAMYAVTPLSPYAFTACTFACCHGLLGLIHSLTTMNDNAEDAAETNKIRGISESFMELIPLPMVNIQLYMRTGHGNGSVALSHALFVVPLFFDLVTKLFTEAGRDNSTETLKELTLIGDVVSLSLLGLQEENNLYLVMALMAFCSKYGTTALKIFADIDRDECSSLFFNSMFFILTGLALNSSIKA